jgi:hypothetical protein
VAIVAALLMFALPAAVGFAQAVAIDDRDDISDNGICQNIIGSVGDINQNQQGSANAVAANGESTSSQEDSAVAEVAQEQGVSIWQVNECLNGVVAGTTGPTIADTTAADTTTADTTTADTTTADTTTADTTTADTTTADTNRQAGVITDTIPDQKLLVNTGGPALVLMPALGLLLISALVLKNLLRR